MVPVPAASFLFACFLAFTPQSTYPPQLFSQFCHYHQQPDGRKEVLCCFCATCSAPNTHFWGDSHLLYHQDPNPLPMLPPPLPAFLPIPAAVLPACSPILISAPVPHHFPSPFSHLYLDHSLLISTFWDSFLRCQSLFSLLLSLHLIPWVHSVSPYISGSLSLGFRSHAFTSPAHAARRCCIMAWREGRRWTRKTKTLYISLLCSCLHFALSLHCAGCAILHGRHSMRAALRDVRGMLRALTPPATDWTGQRTKTRTTGEGFCAKAAATINLEMMMIMTFIKLLINLHSVLY